MRTVTLTHSANIAGLQMKAGTVIDVDAQEVKRLLSAGVIDPEPEEKPEAKAETGKK